MLSAEVVVLAVVSVERLMKVECPVVLDDILAEVAEGASDVPEPEPEPEGETTGLVL